MAHNFQLNEEDTNIQTRRTKSPGGIIGLVIKSGIVKTESQANAVLIGFVFIGIIAIIFLNIVTFG